MTTKVCSKCKEEKDISEFGKDMVRKDKLCVYCKLCISIVTKASHQKNKETKKEYDKKYRKNNLEKIKEKEKIWALKNPDKIKQNAKRWRIKNIEKARSRVNKWCKNNADKIKLKQQNSKNDLHDIYIAHSMHMPIKEFRELTEEEQQIYRTSIKIHRVFTQQKNELL